MKKIIYNYISRVELANKELNFIDCSIEKKRDKISKLQEGINKLQKRRQKIKHPSWVSDIIEVLAQQLATKMDKHFKLFGPFGLRAETTIYLFDDESKSITEQSTWSIRITPGDLDKGELFYDTDELTQETKPNSSGLLNGMKIVIKPLPETIDEIIERLMYRKK
ncbi:hypothetical protein JOD82_002186 [Paenibacillus sp. 1182]|uniref:hypothetical protein n=1 Tax=Paenibacillus sp. 1182 TaxID=2806565 RepID=UPI001AEB524B|nr:hypothetical protein [Paenibacillus sp. 1182]MBP1309166.1 hypothetical protein [Paenibacillus sp. 1182]